MNIGKSFSYVFEDQKWIEKVLIGGLVSLIPVLGSILLSGYFVELVRNVRQGEPEPLPAWDNWGDKLATGFKLFIIVLVWMIPLLFLGMLAFFPAMLSGDSSDGGGILGLLTLCFGCFYVLYAFIFLLATPGIIIKFAETDEISAGFQFGEILSFTTSHLGDIIIYVIVIWLVGFIAGLVGMLLCGIGLLFTSFWASLVGGHLLAQIGLDNANLERPLETLRSHQAIEEGAEGSSDQSEGGEELP